MLSRIEDLLEVHREIDAALEQACFDVLCGRDTGWLARLDALLRWHIRCEDDHLLPAYERLEPDIPRLGNPEVIRNEHRRMEAALTDAAAQSGLDRLATLRRLCALLEHHDEREARTFKPALDRLLDPAVRAGLLETFDATRPALPSLDARSHDARSHAPPHLVAAALSDLDQRLAAAPHANPKLSVLRQRADQALSDGRPLDAYDRLLSIENIIKSVG